MLHRDRLLDELLCLRFGGGIHRRIDVRSEHERLAPVRHCAMRIESGCFGECACRFGVIEAVRQVQALIHEQLRALGFTAHREDVLTDVLKTRR